jgi:hypothetical protein
LAGSFFVRCSGDEHNGTASVLFTPMHLLQGQVCLATKLSGWQTFHLRAAGREIRIAKHG